MQSKLVRDKTPELAEQAGTPIEYVIAASDTTYTRYLVEKFAEVGSAYIAADNEHYLDVLADVLSVANTLALMRGATEEEIKKACDDKNVTQGGYDKRIVMMFEEPVAKKPESKPE